MFEKLHRLICRAMGVTPQQPDPETPHLGQWAAMKKYGPVHYRGYTIEPAPYRGYFVYSSDNYDGPCHPRSGTCRSVEDAKRQIEDLILDEEDDAD